MTEHPYYSFRLTPIFIQNDQVKDRSYIYIGLLVIFFHLLFIGLSQIDSPPLSQPIRKKVMVQTVNLNPPQNAVKATMTPAPPKEAPVALLPQTEIAAPPVQQVPKELPPVAIEPEIIKPEPIQVPAPKPLPKQSPPPVKKQPPPAPKPAPQKKSMTPKPAPKVVSKPENKPAPVKQVTPQPLPKVVPPPNLAELKKKEEQAKEAEKKRLQLEQEKKIAAEKRAEEERKKQALAAEQAEKKRQEQARKLANVQEKLAQNQQKRQNTSQTSTQLPETAALTQIAALQIDAYAQDISAMTNWSAKEADYHEGVINILKASLRLPEYGAVKIELTIRKSGKVEKVRIISSESTKNKQYIDQHIATLQFPAFGNQFVNHETMTFPITLNNERKN